MTTESRIDAVVSFLREAIKGERAKHQAQNKKAMEALWGEIAVEAVFYPIADGMPPTVPESAPSVLVMPVRGEQDGQEEKLHLKLLVTLYEPGDRGFLAPDQAVAIRDLTDKGAGWRALMRVMDRMRGALAGVGVPGSDLTVESLRWSVYTEEGLILDFRPFYVGWVDVDCSCAQGERTRSGAVSELLN